MLLCTGLLHSVAHHKEAEALVSATITGKIAVVAKLLAFHRRRPWRNLHDGVPIATAVKIAAAVKL